MELQLIVGVIVLYLVVNGEKAISEVLKRPLSGKATIVASVLTATVIFGINSVIDVLPPEWMPMLNTVFQLLVLVLGAAGTKRFEKVAIRKIAI